MARAAAKNHPRQPRRTLKLPKVALPDIRRVMRKTVSRTRSFATGTLAETGRQYSHSAAELRHTSTAAKKSLREIWQGFWALLAQPVWVVHPKKEPKKHSRGALFLLDVIRFGGTFAGIFAALFLALNYQSFGSILSEKLNPLQQAHEELSRQTALDGTLREKIMRSPSLAVAGENEEGMAGHLPEVGPPENRIIIPKLGINVPLVTPSYKSLLSEDWERVETDIQEALRMGVVHYPGTARPGQAGNFFVTGHSSYYPWDSGRYKSIFAKLGRLEVGDEYFVYYGGDKFRYVVSDKKEVKPANVDVLDQPLNRRMATLMTCTPVGTTLRRLILTAQEVDLITGEPMQVGEKHKRETVEIPKNMLPI